MLGRGRKKIELPIEEIVKKWEQGVTQKELSKEYGVSRVTINKRISEYYEKEEKGKPKQRIELPIEEIVKKVGARCYAERTFKRIWSFRIYY